MLRELGLILTYLAALTKQKKQNKLFNKFYCAYVSNLKLADSFSKVKHCETKL